MAAPSVDAVFADNPDLTPIEREYASMVTLLDRHVGVILDTLQNLGLDEQTVVIFTSDNGHEIYYSLEGRVTKPYRNMLTGRDFDNLDDKYYSDLAGDVFDGNAGQAGLKRSNLQGGIRVPLIARWPGRTPPNTTSDRLVAHYDLLSTVADLTGYPGDVGGDGLSLAAALVGRESEQAHDHIVFSSYEGPTVLTHDGWKLRTYLQRGAVELFFLPEDPAERRDLSEREPERVAALTESLVTACGGDLSNGLYREENQIEVPSSIERPHSFTRFEDPPHHTGLEHSAGRRAADT